MHIRTWYVGLSSLVGGFRLMELANTRKDVKCLEVGMLSSIPERRAEGRAEAGLNRNQTFSAIAATILLFLAVDSRR
jgi:hypothetical protein